LKRVTVFASGSGSNFQALLDAKESGQLDCIFAGLVAGNENIGAIPRATSRNIPVTVLRSDRFENRALFVEALLRQLATWNTDVIVLAGYLKKIPDEVIGAYRNRILNIHPALLPKFGGKGFYGIHVHEAVIAAKETESGCTVHLVDEIFDHGRILAQRRVQVLPSDTPEQLQMRVLQQEHLLYPETLQSFLKTYREPTTVSNPS
jgi:formyltetrahydrofolate-dependent phosphoribosylglycinamide formyltransferase